MGTSEGTVYYAGKKTVAMTLQSIIESREQGIALSYFDCLKLVFPHMSKYLYAGAVKGDHPLRIHALTCAIAKLVPKNANLAHFTLDNQRMLTDMEVYEKAVKVQEKRKELQERGYIDMTDL